MTAWLATAINAGLLGLVWWLIRRDIDGARKAADEARDEAKKGNESLAAIKETNAAQRAKNDDLQRQIDNMSEAFRGLRTDVDQRLSDIASRLG